MKKVKLLFFGLILSVATAAQATEFSGGKIVSGTVDSVSSEIKLNVLSVFSCNNPRVELKYVMEGRAKFGPYTYRLKITPVNRMACALAEKEFTVSLPQGHRVHDQIIILGDDDSIFEFTVRQSKEPTCLEKVIAEKQELRREMQTLEEVIRDLNVSEAVMFEASLNYLDLSARLDELDTKICY